MTTPRHERLIEKMTDAFWKQGTSVTDPNRMTDVVECLVGILREQPKSVDDDGCLYWAALWLEERLRAEEE